VRNVRRPTLLAATLLTRFRLLRSEEYGLAYVISKMGLLFVYDVQNLTAVYRQRISADPVFLACAAPSIGGVYVVTRRGSILKARSLPLLHTRSLKRTTSIVDCDNVILFIVRRLTSCNYGAHVHRACRVCR
jgi:hypothetical protein